MYLGATPIWEAWNSGGPFIGEMRPNVRVTVDPDWQLTVSTTSNHLGRGTWWREDPSTLTEFALSTTWVVDGRKRQGDRSFQRVRNGEWTYWGPSATSSPITPPPAGITRAQMAIYMKNVIDTAYASNPTEIQPLPAWDGTTDFPDVISLPLNERTAIGQLSQAGLLFGFPDGYFKPTQTMTAAQSAYVTSRVQEYMTGTTSGQTGRGVIELPNVEEVSWDRSIDTDAAECSIVISNIKMKGNTEAQPDEREFGFPGYYTPTRGESMDAGARWANQAQANEWAGILAPNVILRTYEGYGGKHLGVREAVTQGYLKQTGTWMVDRINIGTDGKIKIDARDMARLLLEQQLYPPLVPQGVYPLRYCRYIIMEPNPTYPEGEKRSGNYKDYQDIIYDLLLWAGFHFDEFPNTGAVYPGGPEPTAGTAGFARVHGVLETTGAYADECLPDDLFDKRPVIDAITEIRGISGYLFWIDEMGGAHFRSPNWFERGNFDEDMNHVDYMPEIDERVHLTSYSMTLSSENLRTEIIISSEAVPPVPPYGSSKETYAAFKDAISRATYYTPTLGQEMSHGMELPAMWVNGAFTKQSEQEKMAELIAMHIYYRSRQSSISMVGNPCIQINDQVRVYERTTSETYVHYVRGISSNINNITGRYSMQLTTHWMGDGDYVGEPFEGTKFVAAKNG